MPSRSGLSLLCLMLGASPCLAGADHPLAFDELRFGASASIERADNREEGVFLRGMVLFDPLGQASSDGWRRAMTPRFHIGADLPTAGATSQIYAGFSWTLDLTEIVFVEAGFGGALHDGKLSEDGTPGPKLGSAVLFHEYAAIGVNLAPNWRIIADIAHSSNANLADPNDGLSRAGLLIGYKF